MARMRRPYVQWFARAGYAARGIVFVILAYFTAIAAIDVRRQPVGGTDALRYLLAVPLGNALVAVLTAGLLCFALWREAQFILDLDRIGSDAMGLARRVAYGGAGVFYAGFALVSLSMLVGPDLATSEGEVHDWSAWLLHQPFGRWARSASRSSLRRCASGSPAPARSSAGALSSNRRRGGARLRRLSERAAVFLLIGVFIIFAAFRSNPREAAGLAGALMAIKDQAYGGVLLAVTALGLLAFGAHGLAEALYRRIDGQRITGKVPSWLSV
jgi:hypothetical protein